MIKKLYRWITGWANTKWGVPVLCAVSFAESSFFPIPPDPLQIALSLGRPKRAFYYAMLSLIFSVLGGLLGYYIGLALMETVGQKIINFYHLQDEVEIAKVLYQKYAGWAVFIAGFTPIPYKVFTILSGAFSISLNTFTIASILGRGCRFFLVALLLYLYGEQADQFIYKHANSISIVFVILLVGGWILITYVF